MPRVCSGIISCLFGKSSCKIRNLNTEAIIREPIIIGVPCSDKIESKIIAQTKIKNGFYQINLDEGNYSLFYKNDNGLECCETITRNETAYYNCMYKNEHENCKNNCYLKYQGTPYNILIKKCNDECKIYLNETKVRDCINNITKCEFSLKQNEIKNVDIYINAATD